ncbi:MAG: hypothetical protein HYR83_07015 [Planctomycetes bacterium]|nr:hypothetical protein [Planctomycetota bacterium]
MPAKPRKLRTQEKPKSKPGPQEERLKLDMDWEQAARKIISKKPSNKPEKSSG